MREIKFRAWDGKFWYEWEEEPMHRDWYFVRWENTRISASIICKAWDNETLIKVQFTGLHDRNGKEIYEGDIVKIRESIAGDVVYHDERGMFIIHDGFNEPLFENAFQCEVIGNVYENPELLKA